jgi:hypothetical protein
MKRLIEIIDAIAVCLTGGLAFVAVAMLIIGFAKAAFMTDDNHPVFLLNLRSIAGDAPSSGGLVLIAIIILWGILRWKQGWEVLR